MAYECIRVTSEGPVGLVTLNRPQALNALNTRMIQEIAEALEAFDQDDAIRCSILTGNERAFAAGADIKEMAPMSAADVLKSDFVATWDRLRQLRKPVIAAVSGFALGGGCELAMACDIIVASETARFGQPEINLGVIPGAGGTQWLARLAGKARAMEFVLTGRHFNAQEALQIGLVNRVVPADRYLEEARQLAQEIAAKAPLAVQQAKAAVLQAFHTNLEAGLDFERQAFYLLFATEDRNEGMAAFTEKRKPEFRGR